MSTEFYFVKLAASVDRFSTGHFRLCHFNGPNPSNPHHAAMRALGERFGHCERQQHLDLSEKDAQTFCDYYSTADDGKFRYFYREQDANLFLETMTIYQTFLSIPGFYD